MEIVTGACRTVMHSGDFNRHFWKVNLRRCERKLFSVSGQQLDICGIASVKVSIGNEGKISHQCELVVVNSSRKERCPVAEHMPPKLPKKKNMTNGYFVNIT